MFKVIDTLMKRATWLEKTKGVMLAELNDVPHDDPATDWLHEEAIIACDYQATCNELEIIEGMLALVPEKDMTAYRETLREIAEYDRLFEGEEEVF